MGSVHMKKLKAGRYTELHRFFCNYLRFPGPWKGRVGKDASAISLIHGERTDRISRTISQKNLERKPTKKTTHSPGKMLIHDSERE